jgi:hypothetical protein
MFSHLNCFGKLSLTLLFYNANYDIMTDSILIEENRSSQVDHDVGILYFLAYYVDRISYEPLLNLAVIFYSIAYHALSFEDKVTSIITNNKN